VVVFPREGCGYCAQAKADLRAAGYDFVEVPLAHQVRTKVVGALSGEGTVPQVFINGQRIGGADAVKAWLAKRA